ncbi:hypothetical protein K450DRAFT_282711 [Umbelopsis ramanniana AG]|uniref:Macro domain-containing protein n=1 Tax=Umbelopsis ramanniana AG TaxID=1314678 RepID=A0AAD5E617_UMBRA|nr:uncharacterized protein K450DRAFT_282711 [Umbelopsis ramanniana AG]KAI8577324.1 hypothetical protein K450DRAFT_282711 [Umbelopsis ramanniana AG]
MVSFDCRVDIVKEDITYHAYDAIVNACNRNLDGNYGVSKEIHKVAGPKLLQACQRLGGCEIGNAKITKGYNLSKYVIHAVGPNDLDRGKLRHCYTKSLSLAEEHGCISIIFPCIATGRGHKYNSHREEAAMIALEAVRDYLMDKRKQGKVPFANIVFCVHSGKYEEIYKRLIPMYFNFGPNYVAGQPNHPDQLAPMGHKDTRLQNPVDMTNGGQKYFNNVPRQQNHPTQAAHSDRKNNGPQKPDDATNGGQGYYNNRESNYVPRQQHYPGQVAPKPPYEAAKK